MYKPFVFLIKRSVSVSQTAYGNKMLLLFYAALFSTICNGLMANPVILGNEDDRQSGPRVIVIGAGVAGLTAAAKLHEAGFNVTLFEAMGRIGGRTHTQRLPGPSGQYMEMGGEWIHGETGNIIFELVYPLGLVDNSSTTRKFLPFEYGDNFAFPNGEVLNATLVEEMWLLLETIWFDEEGLGDEWDGDSMGDWARFVMEKFEEFHQIDYAEDLMESILDWAHRTTLAEEASDNWFQSSGSDEGEQYLVLEGIQNVRWIPPYSYSTLFEIILTGNFTEDGNYELPPWIFRNTEVTNVRYSTQQLNVTVTTRDGQSYDADHVVFTGSLGVLKANHMQLFTPPLSAKKELAIENIGFGSVAKINFEFAQPWWPSDYEGLFPVWNDHDYTNTTLDYWREDITMEELMVEHDINGVLIPLWCRSILSFHNVDSGSAPNVFRVWLSGVPTKYLDRMPPAYVTASVMKTLHLFMDASFPGLITEPIRTYTTTWYSNAFVLGSYSYRSTDSDLADVWARDLAEPVLHLASSQPLIAFAGEATSPLFYSTVHGAYETGLREAARIQAFYGK